MNILELLKIFGFVTAIDGLTAISLQSISKITLLAPEGARIVTVTGDTHDISALELAGLEAHCLKIYQSMQPQEGNRILRPH